MIRTPKFQYLYLAEIDQPTGSEGQLKLPTQYEYIESTVGYVGRSSSLSLSVDTS